MKEIKNYMPGLIFTTIIALVSFQIQSIDVIKEMHLSSLIIAILLGVIINNVFKIPRVFEPGIHFALKKILRLAIILLGFRLSFSQVASIGGKGLILVIIVSSFTMFFAKWLGQSLGLNKNLALLIGTGTSICGASAIAAVAPVIEGESDNIKDDIAFAIGTVTLFGTIAMFLYPMIFKFFHLSPLLYAVWTGSSIHEVAQVVAAGFAAGNQAGQFATLVKLTRVLLIIPLVIILGIRQIKKGKNRSKLNFTKITIPWFVFGFLATVIINSLSVIPEKIVSGLVSFDSFLLTIAMAGMGLETSFDKIKKVGIKPFYVGFAIWIFIGSFAFIIARLLFA